MKCSVDGCVFCEIIHSKKELHLKSCDSCVVIRDHKAKAPHHYLVLSRQHISKPTDLTSADIDLLKQMEQCGREFLRAELKAKGEADTVEDMLRIGFHWPPMIRVNHLHMHIIYPVKDLSFLSKMFVFKPGKVFRENHKLIQELEEQMGKKEQFSGNPAKDDVHAGVPAAAIVN